MNAKRLPIELDVLSSFFCEVTVSDIPDLYLAVIKKTSLNKNAYKIELEYEVLRDIQVEEYSVSFKLGFNPNFFWAPHLTPEDGYIIDQHVFRTPAMIAKGEGMTAIVMPDVSSLSRLPSRCYLDMNAGQRTFCLGLSESKVDGHILYKKVTGLKLEKGSLVFSFILMLFECELENPFREVLSYYWLNYGSNDLKNVLPEGDLSPYIKHTYNWAFGSWKDTVWQEFMLNGKKVGAPVFIVTASQSPNYIGIRKEREAKSIWNQAWFCSLRSASGLYRYAKRTNDESLLEKALLTKELALSFPQTDGLFDSVMAVEMESFFAEGKKYQKAKGWDTVYFGNSDRNPFGENLKNAPRHILDMSFTAYYMMLWYTELEQDERLLDYCKSYAQRLISLQSKKGFYPGWIDENGAALGVLDESTESAMSAAFLIKYYKVSGGKAYLESAVKAINALLPLIEEGKWEDFETYWSCSSFWDDNIGKKIDRNGMYKQCNFSMYFASLAMMEAYEATEEAKYLTLGRKVLDELLMTQASWQPDFMPIPAVGGFGVLNCDAEWNDSRQSLFAELIVKYGVLLNETEYAERGLAAIRAGFQMMYCPENPEVKKQWEKVWPHFNELDYGFNMENYGHNGRVDSNGLGIGEFTIYDWGNGAACEGYERMLSHFGEEFMTDGDINCIRMDKNDK